MSDAILVLDQGTTGNTALVISRRGEVIGRAYDEIEQHYPQPGWVEHDPDGIWRSSLATLVAALTDSGLDGDVIAAIGLTNQRETTVVWDRHTGEPVHRAIVWQSRQSAPICAALRADGHEPRVRQLTGLVVDAYFSATKIRWILDQDPVLQQRAERGDLLFGTIDTWLLHKLTGGAVHATDPTNASRTMLFDRHRLEWSDELLELLSIPRAMLPRVSATSSEVFGHTSGLAGLPDGVPIAGIAGDQQSALFGQACWAPGEAKNTYGTGCFLLMNLGDEAREPEGGLLATIVCDRRGRPVHGLEGSVFTAGSAIQWLRDDLGMIDRADETEALARSVDDTRGVYVVPAFSGLGAPYWDPDARGTITGLTRGSGRAHLVRAVLEAIAYQSRDVLDLMNRTSGQPLTELRVDGGAAANDFLMQFQADLVGVPVDRPVQLETTAMGAAFLAGLAVGFWADPDAVRQARHRDRRFEPALHADRRETLYAGWQAAVERARSR
ncbi:MAG: glycerol kinase GlpK [Acidobacteriota bacterium]